MRARLFAILAVLTLLPVGASCAAPSASGGGTVPVTVKEWAIVPSTLQVTAGSVTFMVKNAGTLEHDFAIEGVGKIPSLLAGESKPLQVQLAPGTYRVLCDLPGHHEAGMIGTLVVK